MTATTLDRYDIQILQQVQDNGRISNQELAEAIALSASPCLRRVRQLEADGYIEGYSARLNARQLGLKLTALIQISMDRHTPDRFAVFEEAVKGFPEVLECHLITGQSADYQLKVIVADMDAFQRFLLDKLTHIDGVSGVQSSFILKSPVNGNALPLP